MPNETKRRLLLSKWRGERDELVELRADNEKLQARCVTLEKDNATLMDERNALQSRIDEAESPDAFEVLEQVRYWLLDGIVHHRLVSDPRALLRKVERVL